MKHNEVNVYEICPLIFIDETEDCQEAVNIVDDWLCKMSPKHKVLYNFISDCTTDTMIELRPIRNMTVEKYVKVFNLAKEYFDNVKLAIFFDDFIVDNNGLEVNMITFDSEEEFWNSKFVTKM